MSCDSFASMAFGGVNIIVTPCNTLTDTESSTTLTSLINNPNKNIININIKL